MELTVKEMAARERVTERTVWNWITKGAVDVRRTPGGGVRIVERRSEMRRGESVFLSAAPQSSETA